MPVIRAIDDSPTFNAEALARITERLPLKSIEDALDENNAGVPDVARVIGSVLNYGSSESSRLHAARLAIEFRNLGAKNNDNKIVFNITGQNVNLNNLIVRE